jgi:hypothetical protein
MKAFVFAVIGCLVISVVTAVVLESVNTKGDERPASQNVRLG